MGRQVTIYALILLLGICSGSLLTAQQIYSPKAAAELALELQDTGSANGQSVISAAKDRTSLVDKIEFRTETDRWDTERQEYLVRTSFKSQKEKNATVGIYDSYLDRWKANDAAKRATELKSIYLDLLKVDRLQTKIQYLSERLLLQQDVFTLTQYELVAAGVASPGDVLKAENELLDLQQAKDQALQRLMLQKKEMPIAPAEEWSLAPGQWPTAIEMLSMAQSISVEPIVTGKLAAQKAEVSQRQMTLRREQAQGERVLDFMQLKYTGRDGEAFGNELSVGLGLVLPTGHLNADGIAEATIKLHDEQMKQERLASDIGRNISDAKAEFMLAYSAYETLSRRIDNQDLTGKLAKYRLLEDRQVDMLLMLKEMIAKQQYELEVSTTDMVAAYIKLLYTAGKLSGTTDLWLVK